MPHLGCERRERAQHVGALQQVRPRKLEPGLVAHQVAVEQYVEVHRARRPARRLSPAPAARLDRVQPLEHLAHRVALLILEEFGVEWVRLTLSKPGAVRHSRDVGVMIERTRADLAPPGAPPAERT